jgi:hypothetical protein
LNTKRLAVKSRVLFWDAKTGKKLREVPADEMAVTSLAFSPDGKMLASTGWEGQRIRFWDVESGKGLLDLPCGSGHGVVAFSPDGKTFAWGSLTGEVWLLETASKQLRQKFSGHITFVSSLAFSPDGWVLVSASADTTAIVWDVTGLKSHATTAPLSRDRLGSLWSDLANLDAEKAGRAIWRLAADPKYAVPFIVERLRELPPGDAQRIPQLVADLDSPIFKVREAAEKNLEALGKLAVPSLGEALVRQASLEAKHRIEKLLSKREAPIQSPEVLHVLRALEVLEHVGTPEARQALDDLASHAPEQYFRQEARAAAERLRKR